MRKMHFWELKRDLFFWKKKKIIKLKLISGQQDVMFQIEMKEILPICFRREKKQGAEIAISEILDLIPKPSGNPLPSAAPLPFSTSRNVTSLSFGVFRTHAGKLNH